MTDAMIHRGPNDRGTHTAPGVALGVRRLSVIDVADGHQPFASEDSAVWAVQNGELFNHEALREELARNGHRLHTRCDTEIIPHLYEAHGNDFADRLNGMFAIAVWDERARRAIIVRDRLGVKPLYYARVGDLVEFASELKGVLASGLVPFELDLEAIDAYLTLGFVPGSLTPFAAVSKLPPGCRLVVEDGSVRVERWWSYPRPDHGGRRSSLADEASELLELLDDAVRIRLMSDVPLGVMLSGGLDSSLLATLTARHTSGSVETFSVGFAEDERTSELADARRVANSLGAVHHELELSFSEAAVEPEELLWHLDEPMADLSTLGFQALSRLAAEHVTVALCGQGPDELYGGYDKHRAARAISAAAALPAPLRSLLARITRPLGPTATRLGHTLAADGPAARLLAMSSLADLELRRSLVTGPLARHDGEAALRAVQRIAGDLTSDPLSETLYIDGQLALPDDMLHFSDRASMAYSLEVRVPFLDYRLVEQSARIPPAHKVARGETKRVLRAAARGIVPDDIIDKRKIGFFSLTANAWLARQLEGRAADVLLDPSARISDLLDRKAVEQLVRDHSASTEKQRGRLLLAILMLELWLSTFIPRARMLAETGIVTAGG